MRGNGNKSVVAENLKAAMPFVNANRNMSRNKRMCWRCQKDKSTVGGHKIGRAHV